MKKDTSWYLIGSLLMIVAVGAFLTSNMNHRHRPNTLPRVETTYVDAWHMDSTERYLIRYTGDTAVIKPYKSRRDE
jgi:hypothetical protein